MVSARAERGREAGASAEAPASFAVTARGSVLCLQWLHLAQRPVLGAELAIERLEPLLAGDFAGKLFDLLGPVVTSHAAEKHPRDPVIARLDPKQFLGTLEEPDHPENHT